MEMEKYILSLIGKGMLYGWGISAFCLMGVFILRLFESPEVRRDRKIQEANIEYDLAIRRTRDLLVYRPVNLSPKVELPPRNPPRLTPPRT